MDWFKIAMMFFGGLAFFFYGMSQLSESLQSMASDFIKKLINSLTTNRVLAVLIGCVVTMIVQSSSVTTVMVIGFVNAGLMQLTQAIGVIFGANIGTTITGWILAIKIGKYGLLLIALGVFPMLFFPKERVKQVGKLCFALGLIFFGLQTMSGAFKPLRDDPTFIHMLTYFTADTFLSLLATIGMGCLLTMIIQSSSAMLGITISLAFTGVISFHTAAALVLGENIGTTITAMLASIGANTHAKRAARAHASFNVMGVFIMLFLFEPYIHFIEWIIKGDADFINAAGEKPYIAAHIAASHSIFNIAATMFFLPLLNYLARFVTLITPEKKGAKEINRLKYLGAISDMSPALAIEQAHGELIKMAEITEKSVLLSNQYCLSDGSDSSIVDRVNKYEGITDKIQKEMMLFLSKVMQGNLTEKQSIDVNNMIKISDELESIADAAQSLVSYRKRLTENMQEYTQESLDELRKFSEDTYQFYKQATQGLLDMDTLDLEACIHSEAQLRVRAEEIRDQHLKRIQDGTYSPLTGMNFSDMLVALKRVKNHALNVAQALQGGKAFLES